MTYEEICNYIYEIPKFTKKNSLEHTKEMLQRLSIREHQFEIIHVAGSNGKGSVDVKWDSLLLRTLYAWKNVS